MFSLHSKTNPLWIKAVLDDFDSFLIDHAACERKASATGMAFVVRYPDRPKLVEAMIAFALEELHHFHEVYKLLRQYNLLLAADEKDLYVGALLDWVRTGRDTRLLDRLLVAGVVEARGCERFSLVAEALPIGPLKDFYQEITRSESRHHALFLRLARDHFPEDIVIQRLEELLAYEAEVVSGLPLRAALH